MPAKRLHSCDLPSVSRYDKARPIACPDCGARWIVPPHHEPPSRWVRYGDPLPLKNAPASPGQRPHWIPLDATTLPHPEAADACLGQTSEKCTPRPHACDWARLVSQRFVTSYKASPYLHSVFELSYQGARIPEPMLEAVLVHEDEILWADNALRVLLVKIDPISCA